MVEMGQHIEGAESNDSMTTSVSHSTAIEGRGQKVELSSSAGRTNSAQGTREQRRKQFTIAAAVLLGVYLIVILTEVRCTSETIVQTAALQFG